jgi:hypothetical protein
MKQAFRTSIGAIVATLALAAAAPVMADDSRPAKPTAEAKSPKKAVANPDQRVCIRDTLTGSRVPRNFCKTRAEWAREGQIIAQV